jgi:putative transposase
MPRANRYFVPGQLWHITHRCHEESFLLRFPRDRRRYRYWLFEARRRYGLCVLNFVVTSNHVHLLVKDTVQGAIAQSMQLAAGRTAQEFNERRGRKGAYWEDRYHATAIEAGEHLHRCLVYIDLNMVRAGVVEHPGAWPHGGYVEIQHPRERCRLIDLAELTSLCGFEKLAKFQAAHCQWVAQALTDGRAGREPRWSEAVAVGSRAFVERAKGNLGDLARYREFEEVDGGWVLRQPQCTYSGDSRARIGRSRPKTRCRMMLTSANTTA